MRRDGVIFDLDGTLWDTTGVCVQAWNEVLTRLELGFSPVTEPEMRAVTGFDHESAVRTIFADASDAEVELLVRETQVEDNRAVARRGGVLYPGVREGLPELCRSLSLLVVSNCQSGYIEAFLEWSGLAPCISDFECWGNTGRSKSWNVRQLLERSGLESPVLVGDTEGDRVAARGNGLSFVHATYGFGRLEALADASIDRFDELAPLLQIELRRA